MFGHLRWLGALLALGLASCGVEEKTDLTGTGGSAGASNGGTGGATGGSGGTGASGGTGGVAGQTGGGTGGVAGSVTGGSGGIAGAAGAPAGGGTGGVVDPCGGGCTDPNATCSAGGTCDCNPSYIDIDGNAQSADCKSTTVTGVTLTVGIDHNACGNLVIKFGGPNAVSMTLMSRPGETEGADDGAGGNGGDQSNMVAGFPVTFDDTAAAGAETMGQGPGGQVVCQESGVCDYNPDQGAAAGPATLGAAYNGGTALGLWRLCVADAFPGNSGELQSFSIDVTTSNHTFSGSVAGLTQAIPDDGFNGTLNPSSATCADIVIQ